VKRKKSENSNPLHNEYDLIIIGAGPAGLIAAIESNVNNVRIIVIEQKFKPAMKLRITGKGNCNITNEAGVEEFIENFGRNGKFLRQSFNKFFNEDLIGYFNELGVDFELERGGRYYPKSGKAETIVNSLLQRLDDLNIEIVTNFKAENIIVRKSGEFEIRLSDKDRPDGDLQSSLNLKTERILLATGGRSYPGTGSDGSGFVLAEGLGHTIVPIIPALVPLKGKGNIPEELNGLSIRNCRVKVFSADKKVDDQFGEMEFRDNEIAGPVILSMSKDIVKKIKKGERIFLSIDLKPSLDYKKLDNRILREVKDKKNKNCTDILKTLLPGKAINLFLTLTGIDGKKNPGQLTSEERRNLNNLLKGLKIPVKGSASISKALVTSGGVSLSEIDQATMESKIIKGLYFAGEVMDIDGETGGFNLQAAFSTGWVAGRSLKNSIIKTGE